MVTPPALIAATPVGATTAQRLSQLSTIWRRKVVFPVPALPVRKRLNPVSRTYLSASRKLSSFSITIASAILKMIGLICSAVVDLMYLFDSVHFSNAGYRLVQFVGGVHGIAYAAAYYLVMRLRFQLAHRHPGILGYAFEHVP